MSNKKYCLSCNGGTSYDDVAPSFCSKCGKPYASTIVAKTISKIQPIKSKPSIIIENDEDDEPIENVPQIDHLDFEIDGSNLSGEELLKRRGHTHYSDIKDSPFRDRTPIRDIAKSSPPIERTIPKQKGRPKKISKAEFVKEYYGEVVNISKNDNEVGE